MASARSWSSAWPRSTTPTSPRSGRAGARLALRSDSTRAGDGRNERKSKKAVLQNGHRESGSVSLAGDARRPHRVLGDHEFLVGRDDEDDRRRMLGADDLDVGAVRFGVEMDSHPFHSLEHRFADLPRVFADARREDDGFDAVDGRGKSGEFASDTGDEIGDRVPGRRAVGRLKFAHVLGNARHALEAGALPKKIGYFVRVHLLF